MTDDDHRSDGIVFDLDGTLLDSVPDIQDSMTTVLGELGGRPLNRAEVENLLGSGARVLLERAMRLSLGSTPNQAELDRTLDRYLQDYLKHAIQRSVLYPGVREGLHSLRDQGWILGICTNKPEIHTHIALRGLGVDALFRGVVGADTLDVRKPHPGAVLGAIALMGADPRRSVMVGDSMIDVEAAQAAGVPVIAVSWGYGSEMETSGANAVAHCFGDIPRLAAELLARN